MNRADEFNSFGFPITADFSPGNTFKSLEEINSLLARRLHQAQLPAELYSSEWKERDRKEKLVFTCCYRCCSARLIFTGKSNDKLYKLTNVNNRHTHPVMQDAKSQSNATILRQQFVCPKKFEIGMKFSGVQYAIDCLRRECQEDDVPFSNYSFEQGHEPKCRLKMKCTLCLSIVVFQQCGTELMVSKLCRTHTHDRAAHKENRKKQATNMTGETVQKTLYLNQPIGSVVQKVKEEPNEQQPLQFSFQTQVIDWLAKNGYLSSGNLSQEKNRQLLVCTSPLMIKNYCNSRNGISLQVFHNLFTETPNTRSYKIGLLTILTKGNSLCLAGVAIFKAAVQSDEEGVKKQLIRFLNEKCGQHCGFEDRTTLKTEGMLQKKSFWTRLIADLQRILSRQGELFDARAFQAFSTTQNASILRRLADSICQQPTEFSANPSSASREKQLLEFLREYLDIKSSVADVLEAIDRIDKHLSSSHVKPFGQAQKQPVSHHNAASSKKFLPSSQWMPKFMVSCDQAKSWQLLDSFTSPRVTVMVVEHKQTREKCSITNWECACSEFDRTGVPCAHLVATTTIQNSSRRASVTAKKQSDK